MKLKPSKKNPDPMWRPLSESVYYRPLIIHSEEGIRCEVLCLQWFDVYHYEEWDFLNKNLYESKLDCQKLCDNVNEYLKDFKLDRPDINKYIWKYFKNRNK
jgi:hypothetical protein